MTTMHRLKAGQESFDIVDGPNAGKRFKRGQAYAAGEIPAAEMKKFEEITTEQKPEDRRQKPEKATTKSVVAEASKSKGGDKT